MSTNTDGNGANPSQKEETCLPKLGLLEEDDEFEEFAVEDWNENSENKLDIEEWEADWDDENIEDDFSFQLRAELQKMAQQPTPATN